WVLIDAQDQILGHLAVRVADILRGKDRPEYSPHIICGRGVIVINAEKVKVTGIKEYTKTYVRHSGYRGGDKYTTFRELMARKPKAAIEYAVSGMLPKNRLQSQMMARLRIFVGPDHDLGAQKPTTIKL
ncbi:MAG: 50S ribosomal protein L13, partial [Patescibacteria group bacterium]|nr:50S ribosomal protein L13 [Patescibacteria group bacterium]